MSVDGGVQVHQDLKPENCMVDLATRTLKVRPRACSPMSLYCKG